MKKLAILLCLCMVASLLPFSSLAEDYSNTYCNPLAVPLMNGSDRSGGAPDADHIFAMGDMIVSHLDYAGSRFVNNFGGKISRAAENASRTSADPTGLYVDDTWYIFASQGNNWKSKDFKTWEFFETDARVMAPTVEKINGKWYNAGNGSPLYVSDSIEGPYTECGKFVTPEGNSLVPNNSDVNLFADEDGRAYLYWGMGPGIMGAELDVEKPYQLITEPKQLIGFNREHDWERMGNNNQNYENGYPEGAQMFKKDGVYYLTFAIAGTQYDTYAIGTYKSTEGPLSGFVAQDVPVARSTEGQVCGTGHGSIMEDGNGNLWCFYTVIISYEGDFERRIGVDAAYIDENGNLLSYSGTDTPQFIPSAAADPAKGTDAGLFNISERQDFWASSYSTGRNPVYALDGSYLSWWQPEQEDADKLLLVSLKALYNVSSVQILWKELGDKFVRDNAIQYVIEGRDPETGEWVTLVDKSANTDSIIVSYDTFDTYQTKFVRVRILGCTAEEVDGIGIIEFNVFGENKSIVEAENKVWPGDYVNGEFVSFIEPTEK